MNEEDSNLDPKESLILLNREINQVVYDIIIKLVKQNKYIKDSKISDNEELLKKLKEFLKSLDNSDLLEELSQDASSFHKSQEKPKQTAAGSSGDDFFVKDEPEPLTLEDNSSAPKTQQDQPKQTAAGSSEDDFFVKDEPEPLTLEDNSSAPKTQTDNELKLNRLKKISNDEILKKYLYCEDSQLESRTDSELWNKVQRLLLRVPKNLADDWQQELLEMAKEAGATEDKESFLSLPFSHDKLLYPGLKGIEIEAKGLKLSSTKKFSEPKLSQISLKNKDLFFLAGVVSTCLKFIEIDSSLHHALKIVNRFSVIPLKSQHERSKYINALQNRLYRAIAVEDHKDPTVTFHARLDLDEAIHSLVYLPPADRDSWWGRLQEESRSTLERISDKVRSHDRKVYIRKLWGSYADISHYSKDDLELDRGGTPGDVLACLRVYARIDEEVYPGRVLFRSLR